MRAGVNARMAADAAIRDDDRVRVVRPVGVELFQQLRRKLRALIVPARVSGNAVFEQPARVPAILIANPTPTMMRKRLIPAQPYQGKPPAKLLRKALSESSG